MTLGDFNIYKLIMIKLGIENLLKKSAILKGKRIGLIANATSVDNRLVSSVDLLKTHREIDLSTLFGPQQGFWGETQDNMIEWRSGRYPRYNLPLYSLYGDHRKPTAQMLKNVDVLVFDVQDVGTRIYTYIWTMILAMQACTELGKKFIVCDRPNPINGNDVEGNVSLPEFASFVALYPLPLRHGMTCGEIAVYINNEFKIGCDLDIVEMTGWKRKMWFDETDLPWVVPSANLPTLSSTVVYPGTVIFEGTNISEGRGTTRPFEFIGAPFINGFDLKEELDREKLPGVIFRPCMFIPTFHKFAGRNCGGLQIHVTDRNKFEPVHVALVILEKIRRTYSKDFAWKEPPYEYTFDRLPIDMIFGCDWVRGDLELGKSANGIVKKMERELSKFEATRKKYLLY